MKIKLKIPLESERVGSLMLSGAFYRKIGSKMSECRVQVIEERKTIEVEGEEAGVERFKKWYEWMISEPE